MNETSTNQTDKIIEYSVTESDVEKLREQNVSESEIPAVGTKRKFIKAQHLSPRREHKINVSIYLEGDILDFLRQNSDDSIENQINFFLRKAMNNENQQGQVVEISRQLLNSRDFLTELKEKLKAA
jgi:uncharacterized protein (DUF4415 family)